MSKSKKKDKKSKDTTLTKPEWKKEKKELIRLLKMADKHNDKAVSLTTKARAEMDKSFSFIEDALNSLL